MSTLCRDCLAEFEHPVEARCHGCGGRRLVSHGELGQLAIAHIDCDAFYANIEKRDRPELRDKPVIVGGRHRGVVAAACYVARLYGVHSAMPVFQAKRACPDAVIIPPDMAKYQAIGREIRARMRTLTPLVEPLSIDEAFLDLSGTERLHGGVAARTLAAFALEVERDLGLTLSIGLSYNKFLAKIASDLDKPRGFAAIGRADALDFLAERPVGLLWGVGRALRNRLAGDGINRIGDLRAFSEEELILRYGAIGRRLHRFAQGIDERAVDPSGPTKSISAETTFDEDLCEFPVLATRLWPLCETVARRLRESGLAGRGVTLKLKTAKFRLLTRSRRLADPTRLAEVLYRAALPLLEKEADGRHFRLIGIGAQDLEADDRADDNSLLDPERARLARVEEAIDRLRAKLGRDAVVKGRVFGPKSDALSRAEGGSRSGLRGSHARRNRRSRDTSRRPPRS